MKKNNLFIKNVLIIGLILLAIFVNACNKKENVENKNVEISESQTETNGVKQEDETTVNSNEETSVKVEESKEESTTESIQETKRAPRIKKVNINSTSDFYSLLSLVDEKEHLLENIYTNLGYVYVENTDDGKAKYDAFYNDDIDVVNMDVVQMLSSIDNGNEVKPICKTFANSKAYVMYSNKQIDNASDIKGMKVAGSKNSNYYLLLAKYLEENDMQLSDVEFLDMSPNEAVESLLSGKCDLCVTSDKYGDMLASKNKHKVIDGEGLIDGIEFVCTKSDYVKKNTSILFSYKKIMKDLYTRYGEEPEVFIDELKNKYNVDETVLENYDFNPNIQKSENETITSIMQDLIKYGIIKNEINIKKLMK